MLQLSKYIAFLLPFGIIASEPLELDGERLTVIRLAGLKQELAAKRAQLKACEAEIAKGWHAVLRMFYKSTCEALEVAVGKYIAQVSTLERTLSESRSERALQQRRTKADSEINPGDDCATPPRTAICIAGAARGFPTQLTMELLQKMIKGLRVSARLFFLLKALDHPKTDPHQKVHFPVPHQVEVDSLKTALGKVWIKRHTAEAIILNGSGAVDPSVRACEKDDHSSRRCDVRVVQSDDRVWASYRAKSCPKMRSHWFTTNSEERLIVFHLSLQWCAAAIERDEKRRAKPFQLVAFARPDILWWKPLPAYCTWQWSTVMLRTSNRTAVDRAWIAPRAYFDMLFGQAVLHRDCVTNEEGNTCCEASEDLLLYTVQHRHIPTLKVEMDTSFLRGIPWLNHGICGKKCPFPICAKAMEYFEGDRARCKRETALM